MCFVRKNSGFGTGSGSWLPYSKTGTFTVILGKVHYDKAQGFRGFIENADLRHVVRAGSTNDDFFCRLYITSKDGT